MDQPTPIGTGFFSLLKLASEDAPDNVKRLVDQFLAQKTLVNVMRQYELRNEPLVRNTIDAIVAATGAKLSYDMEHSKIGHESLPKLVANAVAFALIAGAHLAKDKDI